jgi:hypothetical protein
MSHTVWLLVSTMSTIMQIFYTHSGNVLSTSREKKESVLKQEPISNMVISVSSTTQKKQTTPSLTEFKYLSLLPVEIQNHITTYFFDDYNRAHAARLYKQAQLHAQASTEDEAEELEPFNNTQCIQYFYEEDFLHPTYSAIDKCFRRSAANRTYTMSLLIFLRSIHNNDYEYGMNLVNITSKDDLNRPRIIFTTATEFSPGGSQALGCSEDGMVAAAIINNTLHIALWSGKAWEVLPRRSYSLKLVEHFKKTVHIVIKPTHNMIWLFTNMGDFKTVEICERKKTPEDKQKTSTPNNLALFFKYAGVCKNFGQVKPSQNAINFFLIAKAAMLLFHASPHNLHL